MARRTQKDYWPPDVCDFMGKLCDLLEAPNDVRQEWVKDTRATIASIEREGRQPKLRVVGGGKSA